MCIRSRRRGKAEDSGLQAACCSRLYSLVVSTVRVTVGSCSVLVSTRRTDTTAEPQNDAIVQAPQALT
jgi:hypothetical protein